MGIFDNDFTKDGILVELLSCTYNGMYLYKKNDTHIIPIRLISSTPYYDLQGRPVEIPTRGIYIKDGKKVIIGQQ